MKKAFLALAVLSTFTSVTHAQTQNGILVYGSFDGGVRYQKHVGTTAATADAHRITMGSNGTYNSNRLGFKGVEDLGDGMNAHFNLETGFNTGTGAVGDATRFFNRTASMGLGSRFGSLDLGHQYNVAFKIVGTYDPFNYKYTSIIPLAGTFSPTAGGRFDNDIQYVGVFGPITVRAEHALGEVTGIPSAGSATAAGVVYADGPFTLGGAYTWRKMSPTTVGIAGGNVGAVSNNPIVASIPASTFEKNKHWTMGGAYKIGAFRVAAGYADEKQNNGPLVTGQIKNGWFGGSYDFTPATAVTAAMYRTKTTGPGTVVSPTGFDGRKDLIMVGLTYALSKRTNFYAEIDSAKFDGSALGSATAGGTAANPGTAPFNQSRINGASVGISHIF